MYSAIVRFLGLLLWGWRVKIIGAEHLPAQGPYLLVGNHTSYFDAPSLSVALLRTRNIQPMFLTKPTVAGWWSRVMGQAGLRAIGMLAIDPRDRKKILDSAIAYLRTGGVIGIFPEGTRNKPSINPDWRAVMLKGKTGAARLLLATQVPVIPVAIKNVPGFSFGQMFLNVFAFWRRVTLTFGPPLRFGTMPSGEPPKEELEGLTRTMMTAVGRMSGQDYPY
ncbi:MAG: 1-acyl-sn-glycerol-3-phosphate acyltransferase [Candidatus Kerfeldbacteria bacterium]|nr:1-acyl-sn-glycerol-3-phosphate acyltransferase [Candidatus Kerfeldbacteria bacterium]